MKTPLGGWPSMHSTAPLGYTEVTLVCSKSLMAAGERLQKTLSARCSHLRQFPMIRKFEPRDIATSQPPAYAFRKQINVICVTHPHGSQPLSAMRFAPNARCPDR